MLSTVNVQAGRLSQRQEPRSPSRFSLPLPGSRQDERDNPGALDE
jgi:hypothetical protein